jgi:putative membrane protein
MSIEGDRYEIAAGQMALAKSSNQAVRTLAQDLVTDHTKSLQDAIAVAQQLHVDVPSEPSPVQQWILSDLAKESGAQFDRDFATVELKDHMEDIDQANTELSCGVISQIKSLASDDLPTLELHLRLAQAAVASTGGSH